jgi:hypothetical protein
MTSPAFEPDGRWENYYLEFADRAWWLIGTRGKTNHRLATPADYYQGENYDICLTRLKKEGTCSVVVWSRLPGEGRPAIFKITSEGGPGVIHAQKIFPVLEGMRRDMVLDDLALI